MLLFLLNKNEQKKHKKHGKVPFFVLKNQNIANICVDIWKIYAIIIIVKNKRSCFVRVKVRKNVPIKKGRLNMTATIIEIVLVALVLAGIVKEEKLIEFEDKVLDSIANSIAKVIVARRREQLEQERAARIQRAAEARRRRMHVVRDEYAEPELSLYSA